jgi:hypothetical protein
LSWTAAILPILAAIGLLVLPGMAISWCLRLRNLSGVALAPVFSTAVVGVAGIAGGWARIPWGPGLYFSCTVAACLVALLIGRWSGNGSGNHDSITNPRATFSWQWLPTVVAVVMGAVLISWRLMQLFQGPENISQRFDNVFHLNAVRFILDTGNASTLDLASMSGNSGLAAIYPAAWHSFVALTSQVSGASVPVSVNSVNIALSAIAWPLGCIMLVRHVVGANAVAVIAAGVLSASQLSFPYMLLVWGPLFPNALSLSLLPAVIAIVVALTGFSKEDRQHRILWWGSLVLAVPALATAHMSSLNALLAFTLPLLFFAAVRRVREMMAEGARLGRYAKLAAVVAAISVSYAVVWMKLRPGFYDFWGPHQTRSGAIGEAITNAPLNTPVAWTVSVLAVIGLISVWKHPSWRWVPLSYGIAIALYVVDASTPRGPLRDFLTGIWYQDTYRLAAFLPVFATLLASLGVVAVVERMKSANWGKLESVIGDMEKRRHPVVIAAVSLTAAFALAAATQFGALRQYIGESKGFYTFDAASPILSTDEAKLLRRLPNIVPEDAVIADNPWNGSSLAYALSDRKVLVYHLFSGLSPDKITLNEGLASSPDEVDICSAARANNVQFVLDFGEHYVAENPANTQFPGVTNVGSSPRLSLIDSEGNAKLYRLVGCG